MTVDNTQIALGHHPITTTSEKFSDLGLDDDILASIKRIGFVNPTPIQSAVIRPALEGKDLLGLAQTGSGKTAAFVIPLASRLQHGEGVRGLIICPTREIAMQTVAFIKILGKSHSLSCACIIGGMNMRQQIRELKDKPDIIVATPGRLLDHMERRNIRLNNIKELVLDEADHMLDLGFLPQLRSIIKKVPKDRHTMMFSATMPSQIEGLARNYLNDPVRIDIIPDGRAAEGIEHRLYLVDESDKKKCMLALINQELGSTLVFTRRKVDAEWLCRILEKEGHPVTNIHSDRTQQQRTKALKSFRAGQHRILVATDIASRGIDIPGIEHIINFDIPQTVDEYIHRAGRTARMDALGIVSTIASWIEKEMIEKIEKAIDQKLPRCAAPGVEEYVESKPKPAGKRRRPSRW